MFTKLQVALLRLKLSREQATLSREQATLAESGLKISPAADAASTATASGLSTQSGPMRASLNPYRWEKAPPSPPAQLEAVSEETVFSEKHAAEPPPRKAPQGPEKPLGQLSHGQAA